jgi:transcriptional regulator with XRE-family HTH domain
MTSRELKAWRLRNSYSQSELAKALQVDVMTISRWERGVRQIPPFLHLALECMESKGGESRTKGKRKKKERQVKN